MAPCEVAGGPILAGGLFLQNPLCLAPLAGVTSLPIREFFTRLGASLTHTEMVSCAGLVRRNRKTLSMLHTSPFEAPVILQLFAPAADVMVRGAETALNLVRQNGDPPFAGLGINMACPMPKVTKRGAGAALLKNPSDAFAMVRGLKGLGLPVWVKIRRIEAGEAGIEATVRFIEGLLNSGADNVCIHGRTAAQRYEGVADRTVHAAAARLFPGFISASGDVREARDVREYLEMGCVLVMAARGALGNPWLFAEALDALGYAVPEMARDTTSTGRMAALRWLGERAVGTSGEAQAVILLKRLMGGVLRGISGAAELRHQAGCSGSVEEILAVFRKGTEGSDPAGE